MLKIGQIRLSSPVVMGPMAGVTNCAFRLMAKRFGAGLCVSEMISDKAICYGNQKTLAMLAVLEEERPVALQLFGSDAVTMAQAARYIEAHTKADIIDINMGCPVTKVVKTGAGSRLMLEPDKVYEITKAVVSAVRLPVTVKIRAGFDHEHMNAVEIAGIVEKAGASAITVHGRTKTQMYEGKADWNIIAAVKKAVSIPVIGNGDITSPEDAGRMIDETGADGVMVARAALGNPWLLKRIAVYLESGELLDEPGYEERIALCKEHGQSLTALMPEKPAAAIMRGLAPWYLKGLPNSARVKNALTKIESLADMNRILDDYLGKLGETGYNTAD